MAGVSYEIKQLGAQIRDYIERHPGKGVKAVAKLAELAGDLEDEEKGSGPGQTSSALTVSSHHLDKLTNGFNLFKKNTYSKNPELMNRLKTGQWPEVVHDSGMCGFSSMPTTILGLQPGDAFVIRNVANLVPPFEKAGCPSVGSAVEYAVLHLKVTYILVIGHRACGGIGALVKMTPDDGNYSTTFIEKWMAIGKRARESVHVKELRDKDQKVDTICKTCEKESVNNSLANLLTYPFLLEAVMSKRISLHGGYYDHIAGTFQKWNYDVVRV